MAENKKYLDTSSLQNSIDVKAYFFKVLGYWQLFLVTITIALIIARFMNGYKPVSYTHLTLPTIYSV